MFRHVDHGPGPRCSLISLAVHSGSNLQSCGLHVQQHGQNYAEQESERIWAPSRTSVLNPAIMSKIILSKDEIGQHTLDINLKTDV